MKTFLLGILRRMSLKTKLILGAIIVAYMSNLLGADDDTTKPVITPQAEVINIEAATYTPIPTRSATSTGIRTKVPTLVERVTYTPMPQGQPTNTRWPTATYQITRNADSTLMPTAVEPTAFRGEVLIIPTNPQSTASVNCSSDKDCGNFNSCAEFQAFLNVCSYNKDRDWMQFDGNKDDQPCESLCGGWSW